MREICVVEWTRKHETDKDLLVRFAQGEGQTKSGAGDGRQVPRRHQIDLGKRSQLMADARAQRALLV